MYRSDDLAKAEHRITMRRKSEQWRRLSRQLCLQTSTNLSTTTGCGSHGEVPPRAPATARRSVWWVAWAAWSSGGGCTRTSRGPPTYRLSPTCTSSNWASSPCGRTQLTSTAANGRSGFVRHKRGAPGRTCVWPCWANSSWWDGKSAVLCCPCASRRTTCRCGTGRRRTARRRRACTTRCAACCSCPPPCRSPTRSTPRPAPTTSPQRRAPSTPVPHPCRPRAFPNRT